MSYKFVPGQSVAETCFSHCIGLGELMPGRYAMMGQHWVNAKPTAKCYRPSHGCVVQRGEH